MFGALFNIGMYSAAIYFSAKYYKYDIDGFLLCRAHDFMIIISYLQIMFQNNESVKYIKNRIHTFRKQFIHPIEVVKDNKVIYTTSPDKLLENPPLDFDMIIHNVENNSTKKIDKIIFSKIPSGFDTYKICKYNFIQVQLSILDKKYKIELQNKDYNYYIVNNKLSSAFLEYYLYKYCHIDIDDLEDLSYTLSIMDQNANFITLTEKDELVFGEYDYILYEFEPIQENKPNQENELIQKDEPSQENEEIE
uniref:Uncharacterized protein n=1 Tax=viral metagenome TaxID=1070528 RepID=A0A6C0LHK7_9ZZZZ